MSAAATVILEASAANQDDLTMQVPVARLRTLRGQVAETFGLADACSAAWSIFFDSIAAILTVAECDAALRGEADVEAQIVRLKHLLCLTLKCRMYWEGLEEDECFRLRCFRSCWDMDGLARRMEPDEDGLSYVERSQVALDHLHSLSAVVLQLPEATWIDTAKTSVSCIHDRKMASGMEENA